MLNGNLFRVTCVIPTNSKCHLVTMRLLPICISHYLGYAKTSLESVTFFWRCGHSDHITRWIWLYNQPSPWMYTYPSITPTKYGSHPTWQCYFRLVPHSLHLEYLEFPRVLGMDHLNWIPSQVLANPQTSRNEQLSPYNMHKNLQWSKP